MQVSSLIQCSFGSSRNKKVLGNLQGPALAAAICTLKNETKSSLLIICDNPFSVTKIQQDLHALAPSLKVLVFPDYETLPYDALSPHQDIISSRLELLSELASIKNSVVILSLNALMGRLCPTDYVARYSFVLKKGETKDINALRQSLVNNGYLQVAQVLEHGEFAVRGSILDIFPMGSDEPFRIDFFDDEVDSIRTFDVENQRSLKEIDAIKLLPAHEFPLDKEGISAFRSNYRDAFPSVNLNSHTIYQSISKGAIPAGIEYYLPLFFGKSSTFFDYINNDYSLVLVGDIQKAAEDFDIETHKRAALNAGNADHPSLPAYSLFLSPKELFNNIQNYPYISLYENKLSTEQTEKRGVNNANLSNIPQIAFSHQDKNSSGKFVAFASDFIDKGGRIIITAVSEGRRHSLREIFPQILVDKYGLKAASSINDFLTADERLMLSLAPFDSGVIFDEFKIAVITETELYGSQAVKQRVRNKKSSISQEAAIKNLAQLTEGQVVVHIDHGIGRYRGLKTLTIGDVKGEFLTIEYQGGDILNIPITALNKVARYSGSENPQLSRLGTDAWGKKKQKAAQKVRDVAAELLDLYARRESRPGHSFNIDQRALEEFASGFGYEETPDQLAAINATLNDMQQGKPMDRLVCGDVGFGKTEVALRAAFVAANSGMQVAVLVPTTILAEQHYQNFKERFAGTAIVVEELSRFKSTKEQNEILKKLASGGVDIVIGTHKLLSKTVKFKNLGLVIVDEEHRFGVKQKEKLKELRAEVDLLTLTATPIPRTLNMAMEGMRELSIIATPPEHRLAVKTFVSENSDQLCREAIMRELRRGGQVYYLHNDVATINQKAEYLQKLVPEAKIGIGHGQMAERELQKVMRDFYHQRFNLLLCSTIIENGLDVSSANTIIIDRADLLGLAQLHQIRGRVGRSHHQAYAYLFTPPKTLITKDAKRRLDAIASMEELGAGFVLATHDLEIRGAGELLGEEQSGQIESVGFSLYMEMLEAAVKALKNGREPSLAELTLNECDINLHIPALLPDDYIGDINTRLSFYKRLSACTTPEDFEDLKVELIDRYGFLPQSAENLFAISKLKKTAGDLGIVKILGDGSGGLIEFNKDHKVKPEYLISLITTCKHNEYRMSGPNTLRYNLPETDKMPRLKLMQMLINALYAHSYLFSANNTN